MDKDIERIAKEINEESLMVESINNNRLLDTLKACGFKQYDQRGVGLPAIKIAGLKPEGPYNKLDMTVLKMVRNAEGETEKRVRFFENADMDEIVRTINNITRINPTDEAPPDESSSDGGEEPFFYLDASKIISDDVVYAVALQALHDPAEAIPEYEEEIMSPEELEKMFAQPQQ